MQLPTQAKNNVAALELHRQVGASYPTAWLMKHKLLEVMGQREQGRQLTGRMEIDDAYLSGRRTWPACGSVRSRRSRSMSSWPSRSPMPQRAIAPARLFSCLPARSGHSDHGAHLPTSECRSSLQAAAGGSWKFP